MNATAPKGRGRPKVRPQALAGQAPAAREKPADKEQRIYAAIVDRVMEQRLKPGTRLPEAALCELFGVGRTLVQKVLQRLAHDHIVELRPNRSAIVAMPSREDVGKLFEARRALEAAVLPLVAAHASRADYASLRRQLRKEQNAMHRYAQSEWAGLASAFHLRLGELSRNPMLHRYLAEIISRCCLVVALFQPPGNATCEHDEHGRVVDCLEAGDVAGAQRENDRHLRDLEAHLQLVEEDTDLSLADMLGLSTRS